MPSTSGVKLTILKKVLGGDSAVNGLVWSRPARADWDDFEKLGSPGWNWDNLYAAARKVGVPYTGFYLVAKGSYATVGKSQHPGPSVCPRVRLLGQSRFTWTWRPCANIVRSVRPPVRALLVIIIW